MSKLTSGLGIAGEDKEALKAFVATGDTSVPGIEASDLNDGDILARTREKVDNAGRFQFVYIPEDGSAPIESDWIQQDFKKKVIGQWVEGVKGAIIGRGQSKLQEANEKAAEERLRKKREEDMSDEELDGAVPAEDSRDPEPPVSVRGRSGGRPVVPAGKPQQRATSDPGEYVDEQLEMARERLKAAEEMLNEYTREVFLARKDYQKWQALYSALNPTNQQHESELMAVDEVPRIVQRSSPNVRVHKQAT